jgi:shikimate kinase
MSERRIPAGEGNFSTMGESAPDPGHRLRRSVVLIGMMGAGKTAVGRALASRLRVPMRDSDAVIVERARLSIAEIFERYGEAFFREKETQVIAGLLDASPCVLSTGGGAWLSEENRALLTGRAAVVWLDADLELLWARVRHKTTRPLLRTENPRRTLAELLEARAPVYARAPLRLAVRPAWSIQETAGHVLALLIEAGAVEETIGND